MRTPMTDEARTEVVRLVRRVTEDFESGRVRVTLPPLPEADRARLEELKAERRAASRA